MTAHPSCSQPDVRQEWIPTMLLGQVLPQGEAQACHTVLAPLLEL